MKVSSIAIVCSILLTQTVNSLTLSQPDQTIIPSSTQMYTTELTPTTEPKHQNQKRIKEIKINKDYARLQAMKTGSSSSDPPPANWFRTIDGKTEIVRPTVIAGVTISAKPPKETDPLAEWVSLNKEGWPKTIRPEIKNGRTKNGRPNYSTYFQSATTITYNKEQLQAHNMADDEIHEEVVYVSESDLENHLLNPIIRCTPDRYKKKGIGKDTSTEPFCTPEDDVRVRMDKTSFVTWYSRYFSPEVEKVRIHLSNIKESAHQKGLKKRDAIVEDEENDIEYTPFDKRSKVLEHGGKVQNSFYVSEWINNEDGFWPLTVIEDWIGKDAFEKKVLISLQPDNVPDDEFNVLSDSIVVEFWKGSKVSKGDFADLQRLEEKHRAKYLGEADEIEEGLDYEKYMIMMTLPTCVIIIAFGMWLFIKCNSFDLSHLKKRKFARAKTTHRKLPFITKKDRESLPLNNLDISGPKTD
ncbi:hypothetical protein KGF54_004518 [Candida jiufengensis]|uniref:uncharacterized protein n=1 Tax=Candida jiufengensis TaxID=497108 RepID=UPI002225691B|nr:uncharacterized protein KGF54_004518 [Candida jiufengensis]KAI5951444.1 hypothetical protein KGF54_004518 [Candida jiufengensis]